MNRSLEGKVVYAIIQIGIHLLVLYYYLNGSLAKLFPAQWSEQFITAVLLILALSLALLFLNFKTIQKGLFFIRMFFLMAISVPFTGNSGTFGLLYALQTFECFFVFKSKTAFGIVSFYILFLFWLVNQKIVLWDFYNPNSSAKYFTFAILFFHCAVGSAIGHFVDKEQRHLFKERQLFEEMKASTRCLVEANIGLQTVAAETELSSVFRERTRIAREIHDSMAYTFTNLIALLNAFLLQKKAKGQEVPPEIEKAKDLALDGLSSLRQALRTLRPSENENYNGLGSLLRLIRIFKQATGIAVNLNFGEVPQYIGESLENVIYRVVQEGLTNAYRHGKASEVYISLHLIGNGVEVNIKDNGCGTDSPVDGYGLVGMKERVTELGGTVTINSKPGNGFILRIWLPLEKEDEDHGTDPDYDC
jgi:signal transduction histidine kinase